MAVLGIDFGNPYLVGFLLMTALVAHFVADLIVVWLSRGASLAYFMSKVKRRPVMECIEGRRALFALPKFRGPKLWRTKRFGTHHAPDESIYHATGGAFKFTVLGATGGASVPEYAAMCNALVDMGINDINEAEKVYKKEKKLTARLPLRVWCSKHEELINTPEEMRKHLELDDHKKAKTSKNPLKWLEFVSNAIKWEDYAKFQKYNENPAYTDSAIEHGVSAQLASMRRAPMDIMKIIVLLVSVVVVIYMISVLLGQGGLFGGGGGGGGGAPPQSTTATLLGMLGRW